MGKKWQYDVPFGEITIGEKDGFITFAKFRDSDDRIDNYVFKETPLIKKAAKQFAEYFEGIRKEFDLPIALRGTQFQEKVWQALLTIPVAETRSYKDIAEQIGNPKAARAVGMANNRNPISVIVPCHRVIGHNGDLVGYGGGLPVKRYLLDLEKTFYQTQYFEYGQKEVNYLKSRDPVLGTAMERIGEIKREVIPDIFMALVKSIVGQQISTKAQKTVWGRIKRNISPLTPKAVDNMSAEELQGHGISMRKASYIKEIAASVLDGSLDLVQLQELSDEDVCKRLIQIKGVGAWTAEMLMTFSMQRPDIISWGDLAIQRGLRMLYQQEEITPELFAEYKKRYSPHATVASLYLWAIAGGACPELVDPAALNENKVKGSR
jgi:O-6-methylguanine DNA methyltransferase